MNQLLTITLFMFCSILSVLSADVVIERQEVTSEVPIDLYDPTTLETISGTVLSVTTVLTPLHAYYGILVNLRTDHGDIDVYLAPRWFLQRQNLSVTPGESLEVTGSLIDLEGKPAIVAAEVRKYQIIYRLRNKLNGTPLWRSS